MPVNAGQSSRSNGCAFLKGIVYGNGDEVFDITKEKTRVECGEAVFENREERCVRDNAFQSGARYTAVEQCASVNKTR